MNGRADQLQSHLALTGHVSQHTQQMQGNRLAGLHCQHLAIQPFGLRILTAALMRHGGLQCLLDTGNTTIFDKFRLWRQFTHPNSIMQALVCPPAH